MLRRHLAGLLTAVGVVTVGVIGASPASADVYHVGCAGNGSYAVLIDKAGDPSQCFNWNGHGSHYLPVNDYYDVVCANRDGVIVWWTNGDKTPLPAGVCDNPNSHDWSKISEIYVP